MRKGKSVWILSLLLALILGSCAPDAGVPDSSAESASLSSDENDGSVDDLETHYCYADEENGILLYYSTEFSENAQFEDGYVCFESNLEGVSLRYWVIPNAYDEDVAAFIDHISYDEVEALEGNAVVGRGTDVNTETGEDTLNSYFWMVEPERIVCVQITCPSEKDTELWYSKLKAGAVYMEYAETGEAGETISEEDALDVLTAALDSKLIEGTAIVSYGEGSIDGKHCWTFAFGANTVEKFTAEEHYAVMDDGSIWILDILNGGEYVPYAAG